MHSNEMAKAVIKPNMFKSEEKLIFSIYNNMPIESIKN